MLFSNIKDITECGANLLSSIEDQMEIAEENEVPTVGISFVEMAEVCVFDFETDHCYISSYQDV